MAFSLNCGGDKKNPLKDDELTLPLQAYTGNDMRMDGYYYQEIASTTEGFGSSYFFYENGVLFYSGGFRLDQQKEIENRFIDFGWIDDSSNRKHQWGVFIIDGGRIKFERWYPSSGGGLPAYVREGTILNDTTFRIERSYRIVDGDRTEERDRNEIYHFVEFSPKPDSTNEFIP